MGFPSVPLNFRPADGSTPSPLLSERRSRRDSVLTKFVLLAVICGAVLVGTAMVVS